MSQQFCLICGYPVHKIGKDSYGHDLPQGRLYSTQMEEFPECWNDPKVSDPAIHLRTSLRRIAELESQQAADREELELIKNLLGYLRDEGGLDCLNVHEDCGGCSSCRLKMIAESNPAATEGGR